MSLFIGDLSFDGSSLHANVKLAVLIGSAVPPWASEPDIRSTGGHRDGA